MRRILAVIGLAFAEAVYAQVPISGLPDGAAITGVEQVPAVQSAVTVKTTPSALSTYSLGQLATSGLFTVNGSWTFGNTSTPLVPSVRLNSANPQFELQRADAAADTRRWNWFANTTVLEHRVCNDNGNVCQPYFLIGRTGAAVSQITFGNTGNNPAFAWNGTGSWTVAGTTGTAGQILTSNGNAAAPSWQTPISSTSGTYTPTLANGLNIASSQAYISSFTRVGDVVTVYGRVDATPSAAGGVPCLVGISLPIASNITVDTEVNGVANGAESGLNVNTPGLIYGDIGTGNNRALLEFTASSTNVRRFRFSFQYTVQ